MEKVNFIPLAAKSTLVLKRRNHGASKSLKGRMA